MLSADAEGVLVRIKAVPGAKRDEITGRLGDRLKIRVAAPPEDGRANEAICRVLAAELGLRPGAVEIIAGHTHPEKTARLRGTTRQALEGRW